MKLLYGRDLASFIKVRQAKQVRNLRQSWQTFPKLAIIQTVDDPVIGTYIDLKKRYGSDILIEVDSYMVEHSQLKELIDRLNNDEAVHGVILQLPLAEPAETEEMVNLVAPEKDVDGLGARTGYTPATPLAIDWLLAGHNINLVDKKIAVVGRGRLVGEPLAKLWASQGLDVTVFDKSNPVSDKLLNYDVVATAVGQAGIIHSEFIKSGAIVIDAGTASDSGTIRGDVVESAYQRDDITITPQRGGVGPLTVAALFDNVITAARQTANDK